MKNIGDQSISELEGWKWKGEIPTRETHSSVQARYYELHNRPVSELELSDIRFLVGQNAGLEYLIPICLEKLREDALVETEYYPGDLLSVLLKVNDVPNYWTTHKKERQELLDIYESQKLILEADKRIKRSYQKFLAS